MSDFERMEESLRQLYALEGRQVERDLRLMNELGVEEFESIYGHIEFDDDVNECAYYDDPEFDEEE